MSAKSTRRMELLQSIVEWMTALPPLWAYVFILAIAYGENILPPIPGDMVVVFGGYLVGRGILSLPVVIALATLGGTLGFMTVYAIGRYFGPAILDPERFRWLPHKGLEKARRWIRKWGYAVVAANRFLTGVRSVISLSVGMAGMNAWKTALWATFSAVVWTGLIAYAGYALGENWRVIRHYLVDYSRIVLAILAVLAIVRGLWWYRQRRRRKESDPD